MIGFGGPVWPPRCRGWLAAVSNASNIKAFVSRPQCNQSLLPHLRSCCLLTLPALRQWWSWINPQKWWTFWSFVTILWSQAHHVTPDQTAKTFAKFLWQGYNSIFGAPANLLSDWETSFDSNIIRELCELMGIRNIRTLPYHAQTNGQVEWTHPMLMCMIGKLSKDLKADWLKHLPKLGHAYISMRLAITRYSPHYLMFRHQPCLPVNIYFSMVQGVQKYQCVDH